jgi:hypothetical protein
MTLLQRQPLDLDERTRAALTELQGLVTQHFPDATFRVEGAIDDPAIVHLVATVDADFDDVLDHVIDRVMAFQIDDELPVHVIPVRPRASALALQRAEQSEADR